MKGTYNKYKKKIEKLTFLAKRRYLANKIEVIKGNSKALWKIINEIVHRKNKRHGKISHLKINDKAIYDPKEIANELNNYFVNIGTPLASKINPPPIDHNHYLPTPQP